MISPGTLLALGASAQVVSPLDPVQLVSLLGAFLQLVVYALMQLGRLASASYPYQVADRSAMVTSSVSPLRWLITLV